MSEYWDSLRDWGMAEWNKTKDINNLGPAPEGYTDWGDASQKYQQATGNDWVTGKPLGGNEAKGNDNPVVPASKGWDAYKTPEMDISYNVQKYMGQDSPLMAQSELLAKRNQNNMGLLNSQGTISSVQNSMFNAAMPYASADANNAIAIGLARMGDDLQRDLSTASINSAQRTSAANIYGDLVNTQLGNMGSLMRSDRGWNQTMQNDFENIINASKNWVSGMFNIPLS
jgi:hypothetical protein